MKEKIKHLLSQQSYINSSVTGMTPAAVLIPMFCRNGISSILLTKRTHLVRHHKGQISFPGGVQDFEEPLETTARREAFEEIGLEQNRIEILGQLKTTITVTGYSVTPYVGVIPYPYPFKINRDEVEKLIFVPFAFFMNPENAHTEPFEYEGKLFETEKYEYEGNIIWGATARILRIFRQILHSELDDYNQCIE